MHIDKHFGLAVVIGVGAAAFLGILFYKYAGVPAVEDIGPLTVPQVTETVVDEADESAAVNIDRTDTTTDIAAEVEAIDLGDLDADFAEIDRDLGSL